MRTPQPCLNLCYGQSILGHEFILGSVYLRHEASVYHSNDIFEYITDDMTTIRSTYHVATILMGDFNVRTGQYRILSLYKSKTNYFLIKIIIHIYIAHYSHCALMLFFKSTQLYNIAMYNTVIQILKLHRSQRPYTK